MNFNNFKTFNIEDKEVVALKNIEEEYYAIDIIIYFNGYRAKLDVQFLTPHDRDSAFTQIDEEKLKPLISQVDFTEKEE